VEFKLNKYNEKRREEKREIALTSVGLERVYYVQ
jgi:hypothetical protein